MGLIRCHWTPAEDMLLRKYIEARGEGDWRSVPIKAGLQRCGRSCRLRWMNYLRPGVKRGHITPEEEDLIIRLHRLLGSRWSLIAGRIPGRSDNDIKNYWKTHLSKKLGKHKRFVEPSDNNLESTPKKQVAIEIHDVNNNICFGSELLVSNNCQDYVYSVCKHPINFYHEIEKFLMESEEPSITTNMYCKQCRCVPNDSVCPEEVQLNFLSALSSKVNLTPEVNCSRRHNPYCEIAVDGMWNIANYNPQLSHIMEHGMRTELDALNVIPAITTDYTGTV